MARTSYGAMPMTIRREVPKRVGSQMQSGYIFGHNPRKQALSTMEGVGGRIPKKVNLTSATAPHKTDMGSFDSKHGFVKTETKTTPGSFGNTGMTGES